MFIHVFTGLALGALAYAPLLHQQGSSDQRTPTQEEMARFATAGDPGAEHERLASLTGTWRIERQEWRDKSQPRPVISKAICDAKTILGGRFLQISTTWKRGAQRLQGLVLVGCDRRSGAYTIQHMDSTRSWSRIASGKWAASKHSLILRGSDQDPMTKTTVDFDYILKFSGKNNWTLTTYETHTRGDSKKRFKSLTLRATRSATASSGR